MNKNFIEFMFAGTMALLFLNSIFNSLEFTVNSIVSAFSYILPFILGFTIYHFMQLIVLLFQVRDTFKLDKALRNNQAPQTQEELSFLFNTNKRLFEETTSIGFRFFLGLFAITSLHLIEHTFVSKNLFFNTLSHPLHTLNLSILTFFFVLTLMDFAKISTSSEPNN